MKPEEILALQDTLNLTCGDVTISTRLDWMGPEGRLLVTSHPERQTLPGDIGEGQAVVLMFTRQNGLYSFKAVVEDCRLQQGRLVCSLRAVSDVTRHQRRDGYRHPIALNMSFMVDDPAQPPYREDTRSINLSEKGVLFTSQAELAKGTRLRLWLRLGPSDPLAIRARVVRVGAPRQVGSPWVIAAQFLEDEIAGQERIRRFVLEKQIEGRRLRP